MIKRLVAIVLLTVCAGCSTPDNVAEFLRYARGLSEIARENDAAVTVTVHSTGSPEVYEKASLGLDSGITATASLQLNAADPDEPIGGSKPETE